jgi:hypothetical protein
MPLRPLDFDDSPLDDLEREYVRRVLGINGRPGTATYIESDVRMAMLTPAQCQIVRVILEDVDAYGIDTTKAIGGSTGINYDPQRDTGYGANELRRMLYPTDANDPMNVTVAQSLPGQLQFIEVEYKTGPQTEFN